jgi:hypothetical protein
LTLSKRHLTIGLVLAVALIAVQGVGAQDGEIIYACANLSDGSVRIVDTPDACRKNEGPLQWNVQGPTGEPGEQGPQGEPALCPPAEVQVIGVEGPQGPPGVDGQDGVDGLSGYEIVEEIYSEDVVEPFEYLHLYASCPAEKRALGSGFALFPGDQFDQMASNPTADGQHWRAIVYNKTSVAHVVALRVYVICAQVN